MPCGTVENYALVRAARSHRFLLAHASSNRRARLHREQGSQARPRDAPDQERLRAAADRKTRLVELSKFTVALISDYLLIERSYWGGIRLTLRFLLMWRQASTRHNFRQLWRYAGHHQLKRNRKQDYTNRNEKIKKQVQR